ncbi:hypothetical protein BDP27DRAFT_1332893 [Rhodocollybia butyracea]|uniref:Secreted protein n=1 Tax=Rhodocollybia butyracea TaxID=206335 RepID=A0A9P5PJ88_9AGAR|nr:hypothetical protein BDP27DRAFT_1332893 [Rhodocollybia butyracea]
MPHPPFPFLSLHAWCVRVLSSCFLTADVGRPVSPCVLELADTVPRLLDFVRANFIRKHTLPSSFHFSFLPFLLMKATSLCVCLLLRLGSQA